MAENAAQSYAKHAKWDPKFHFFLGPLLFLLFIYSLIHAYRNPDKFNFAFIALVVAAIVGAFTTRLYSLKVQDRVIRVEERLRLLALAPQLGARIAELSEAQLIALRFASDGELPALAERALNEKLSRDDIKKGIVNWRADHWRV